MQVSVHEAKTQLSKLIAAAEAGEEVIIARRDTPVVRLQKIVPSKIDRMAGFGCLKDKLPADFTDQLLDDSAINRQIEDDFYGS